MKLTNRIVVIYCLFLLMHVASAANTNGSLCEDSGDGRLRIGVLCDNFNDEDYTGWTAWPNSGYSMPTLSAANGALNMSGNGTAGFLVKNITLYTDMRILSKFKAYNNINAYTDVSDIRGNVSRTDEDPVWMNCQYSVFGPNGIRNSIYCYNGTSWGPPYVNDSTKTWYLNEWNYFIFSVYGTTYTGHSSNISFIDALSETPITGTSSQWLNGTAIQFGYVPNSTSVGSFDDIRAIPLNSEGSPVTHGNFTSWKNWTNDNVTYKIVTNVTTPSGTNYTTWYKQNSSSTWISTGGAFTGNTTLTLETSAQYEHIDYKVVLTGNETETPSLIKITYYGQEPSTTYETIDSPSSTCTDQGDQHIKLGIICDNFNDNNFTNWSYGNISGTIVWSSADGLLNLSGESARGHIYQNISRYQNARVLVSGYMFNNITSYWDIVDLYGNLSRHNSVLDMVQASLGDTSNRTDIYSYDYTDNGNAINDTTNFWFTSGQKIYVIFDVNNSNGSLATYTMYISNVSYNDAILRGVQSSGTNNTWLNGSTIQIGGLIIGSGILSWDEIRMMPLHGNGTVKSSANYSVNHYSATGYSTTAIVINGSFPSNTNYTINIVNITDGTTIESSSVYSANATWNNFTSIVNFTLNLTLNGNSTATPDISLITYTETSITNATPSLTSITNGTVGDTWGLVNFTVNQTNAITHVKFTTNPSMQSPNQTINDTTGTDRSVNVTGLFNNTKYYYSVFAYNSSNTSLYTNSTVYNFTTSSNVTPNITSWSNNKTSNSTFNFSLNISEHANFNVTADQQITTYNWYKDNTNQNVNYNNITINWSSSGIKTIKSNVTNSIGTSSTLQWNVTVNTISQVTGLSNDTPTQTAVNIIWTSITGANYYQVYKDGVHLAYTQNSYYNITGLTASTSYTFFVRANDTDNNFGSNSSNLTVTTIATVSVPSSPGGGGGGSSKSVTPKPTTTTTTSTEPYAEFRDSEPITLLEVPATIVGVILSFIETVINTIISYIPL